MYKLDQKIFSKNIFEDNKQIHVDAYTCTPVAYIACALEKSASILLYISLYFFCSWIQQLNITFADFLIFLYYKFGVLF